MAQPILEVSGLGKRFGGFVALEGIEYRQHRYVGLVIRENLGCPFVDVLAFQSGRQPVDCAHHQADCHPPGDS